MSLISLTALLTKASYVGLTALGLCTIKRFENGAVCRSTARIDGKVVIITGANSGIGKEAAKELVKRGGKIYLACRSLERAQEAVDDIKKETPLGRSHLHVMHLDMNSLDSVRNFVKEFKEREKKLDLLINNAGIAYVPYAKTVDGFESTLGVNHLGPFLLTHLLMDTLMASDTGARVVNVSSRAHVFGAIKFDDLMLEHGYSPSTAYRQSKLANILFTRELARRSGNAKVTVYALHPGVVRTEIFRHTILAPRSSVLQLFVSMLTWPFTKDVWYGTQTVLHCALDENLASETGHYYCECAQKEPAAQGRDDVAARRLWDASVKLVKLKPNEMHSLLR